MGEQGLALLMTPPCYWPGDLMARRGDAHTGCTPSITAQPLGASHPESFLKETPHFQHLLKALEAAPLPADVSSCWCSQDCAALPQGLHPQQNSSLSSPLHQRAPGEPHLKCKRWGHRQTPPPPAWILGPHGLNRKAPPLYSLQCIFIVYLKMY